MATQHNQPDSLPPGATELWLGTWLADRQLLLRSLSLSLKHQLCEYITYHKTNKKEV